MFTLGGISGVMLAMVPLDIYVSDTYFIVAHIHYVLFGGSLFTIFAGVYYWFPKMTGRMYDERLGRIHFWMTFVAFNVTFAPMHLIGVQGMPRRVSDYADQFATWNLIISMASFVLGLSRADLPLQHDRLVARRPARRRQPVAGAHARVAGLVAAADLQLRRSPVRRRRAVRVRRSRRGSRRSSRAPRSLPSPPEPSASALVDRRRSTERRCGRSSSSPTRRSAARSCSTCAREEAAKGPMRIVLCVPRKIPSHGNVIYIDAIYDAAQVRIDLARSVLREMGIDAIGEVGDPDPVHRDDGRDRRSTIRIS